MVDDTFQLVPLLNFKADDCGQCRCLTALLFAHVRAQDHDIEVSPEAGRLRAVGRLVLSTWRRAVRLGNFCSNSPFWHAC